LTAPQEAFSSVSKKIYSLSFRTSGKTIETEGMGTCLVFMEALTRLRQGYSHQIFVDGRSTRQRHCPFDPAARSHDNQNNCLSYSSTLLLVETMRQCTFSILLNMYISLYPKTLGAYKSKVKVNLSLYRQWRPLGLREIEAPTFSDIRHTDGLLCKSKHLKMHYLG
jgi:hypothetical protein